MSRKQTSNLDVSQLSKSKSIIYPHYFTYPQEPYMKSTRCSLLMWFMTLKDVLFWSLALNIWTFFWVLKNQFWIGSAPEKVSSLLLSTFVWFFPISTLISFSFQTRYKSKKTIVNINTVAVCFQRRSIIVSPQLPRLKK